MVQETALTHHSIDEMRMMDQIGFLHDSAASEPCLFDMMEESAFGSLGWSLINCQASAKVQRINTPDSLDDVHGNPFVFIQQKEEIILEKSEDVLSLQSFDSDETKEMQIFDNLLGQVYDDITLDNDSWVQIESPSSAGVTPLSWSLVNFQPFESLDQTSEEDEKQEDSEEEYKEEDPQDKRCRSKKGKKIKTPSRTPEPKITKKKAICGRKRSASVVAATLSADDANVQSCCCLSGCDNLVTNRLRFSLRRNHMFKKEYLDKGWNKVCQYHYFAVIIFCHFSFNLNRTYINTKKLPTQE
jgi:hypothetical protein